MIYRKLKQQVTQKNGDLFYNTLRILEGRGAME
jgi:hypothetical protein